MSIETTCAITGHRPEKLGFASTDTSCAEYVRFRGELTSAICALAADGVDTFIVGGARGVDTWAMEAVSMLKYHDPSVRMIAALPYPGHNPFREEAERQHYQVLLARCDKIVYVSGNYHAKCFLARNRWMVDHAERVLAVWNGSVHSGTAQTVRYAQKLERRVTRLTPNASVR